MKHIVFLGATTLAYLLTACGGENPKDTAEDKPKTEVPQEPAKDEPKQPEKPQTEPLSPEAQKIAKKWTLREFTHTDGRKEDVAKAKQVMILKADGTFEKMQNEKVISTGTWLVKSNVLVTTSAKGEIEKAPIKEATDKKLVTTSDEGKMTETYEATE